MIECDTPKDVTVTGIEYVPGGVALLVVPCPLEPVLVVVVPPIAPVQLVMPAEIATARTAISSDLRFRRSAMGMTTIANASGHGRMIVAGEACAVSPEPPVYTSTSTFPCTPAVNVMLDGLNRQIAFVGSVPHCSANVPAAPLGVIRTR